MGLYHLSHTHTLYMPKSKETLCNRSQGTGQQMREIRCENDTEQKCTKNDTNAETWCEKPIEQKTHQKQQIAVHKIKAVTQQMGGSIRKTSEVERSPHRPNCRQIAPKLASSLASAGRPALGPGISADQSTQRLLESNVPNCGASSSAQS